MIRHKRRRDETFNQSKCCENGSRRRRTWKTPRYYFDDASSVNFSWRQTTTSPHSGILIKFIFFICWLIIESSERREKFCVYRRRKKSNNWRKLIFFPDLESNCESRWRKAGANCFVAMKSCSIFQKSFYARNSKHSTLSDKSQNSQCTQKISRFPISCSLLVSLKKEMKL